MLDPAICGKGAIVSKHYWFVPKDQRHINWVFHQDGPGGVLQLRPSYLSLRCPCCGKFDEYAALNLPIESGVSIRATTDFVGTNDDFLCANRRLRHLITSEGITGVSFLDLPDDPQYSVIKPELTVATDLSKAGFQNEGAPCACCGRYAGRFVGPMFASLAFPDDPLAMFVPDVPPESMLGRKTFLVAAEPVMRIFKSNKVSGLNYIVR